MPLRRPSGFSSRTCRSVCTEVQKCKSGLSLSQPPLLAASRQQQTAAAFRGKRQGATAPVPGAFPGMPEKARPPIPSRHTTLPREARVPQAEESGTGNAGGGLGSGGGRDALPRRCHGRSALISAPWHTTNQPRSTLTGPRKRFRRLLTPGL